MTSGPSSLGIALTIIFVISLLALLTQLVFLLCRRRRRRNIPIHVHENVPEPSSFSKELLLFLFCMRTQTNHSRVEPDPNTDPNSPDSAEMELIDLLKLQASRFLYTIKEEEEREDLEFAENKTKSTMSLKECMKIDEESPETSPEMVPESLEELPAVTVDYDPNYSTENKTTPFSTPCDSPLYLTPVASPIHEELIAGGAAGAFAKTAISPLERVKILKQTRTKHFNSLGVYQSLKKILKREGVVGFYRGNGASVLRVVPYAALNFMAYERYRGWILNNYNDSGVVVGTGSLVDLLAGSAAGGTAVLCTYPLDLARTKLAYQVVDTNHFYNGVKHVIQTVYKEGGLRALYRGIGPTLFGILPYAGLKFYVYEELKRHVPEEHQSSILARLSCGALAGLLGQTFTYPLDVVKKQIQVEHLHPQPSGALYPQNRTTFNGLSSIVRNQGWRQLFAGLSINYMKIVPSVAIGFTAYDTMKAWLHIPPRQKSKSL